MIPQFTQSVQPLCTLATESEAKLKFLKFPDSELESMRGGVTGPYCEWSRTLPTQFSIAQVERSVSIVDPCYWTPQLPFLYTLSLDAQFHSGHTTSVERQFGIRRWEAVDANFRLERKRFVLRGTAVPAADATMLAEARQAEAAIVLKNPSEATCESASRLGVPLIVDLRSQVTDWTAKLRQLAWHAAVMVVLVDDDAPAFLHGVGLPLLAAKVVGPYDDPDSLAKQPWISVMAVELYPGERPPMWLAQCGRPVIAMRRGASHLSVSEARLACDRLQAELAPEFNLAGYVVSNP